jgi:predicted PurR-regulated permease PerM
MSKRASKEEWEAVLESLTTETKKRNAPTNGLVTWLGQVFGGLVGIGILSFISGFFLMKLNDYANRAWDFVPDGASYWECFNVMVFVWLFYMLKLAILHSFASPKKGDKE